MPLKALNIHSNDGHYSKRNTDGFDGLMIYYFPRNDIAATDGLRQENKDTIETKRFNLFVIQLSTSAIKQN